MKLHVGKDIGGYTFTPGVPGVGTVSLSLPYTITLDQVLLITNVTNGIIIYNFADSTKTATLLNNVLTLQFDTATMSSSDALAIYIDAPASDVIGELDPLKVQYTYDTNMAQALGTTSLVDGLGNLKTNNSFSNKFSNSNLKGAGSYFYVNCEGFQTAAIQCYGVWVATLSFEATTSGGDWVAISGSSVVSGVSVTAVATPQIVRFAVSGLKAIRVVLTAYTSGVVGVSAGLSAGLGGVGINGGASTGLGSLSQPLSQKASSFELNTFDTNVSTVLGNAALWRPGDLSTYDPPISPTINRTQPTAYAEPKFSKWPQVFPRLRVESGGSNRLPFAQEENTNKIMATNMRAENLLEEILMQLQLMNQNFAAVHSIDLPNGTKEVR